jgi:hypothetical protein
MKGFVKVRWENAKLQTNSVFALEHEGNIHCHSERLVPLLHHLSAVKMCSRASSFVEIVRSNVASVHKAVLQERSDCVCSFLNEISLQAKGKRTLLAITGYWVSVKKE